MGAIACTQTKKKGIVQQFFNRCAFTKCPPEPKFGLLRSRELNAGPKANIQLNVDHLMMEEKQCRQECGPGGSHLRGMGGVGDGELQFGKLH